MSEKNKVLLVHEKLMHFVLVKLVENALSLFRQFLDNLRPREAEKTVGPRLQPNLCVFVERRFAGLRQLLGVYQGRQVVG